KRRHACARGVSGRAAGSPSGTSVVVCSRGSATATVALRLLRMLAEPALELLQTNRPGGGDLTDDADWLRGALDRWGLAGEHVDPRELKRLRKTMRAVVAVIDSGRLPTDEELTALNVYIAGVPVVA